MNFLSVNDLPKLDLGRFFPFADENNFDCQDYYSDPIHGGKSYAGLEYVENEKGYDLFSWNATDREIQLIKEFQNHCMERLGDCPIADNY